MQIPKIANGCHYSVIYLGNQTLAYPFGWRSDRWLQNVLEPQYGDVGFNQQAIGCSPKGCGNQTLEPLTTLEPLKPIPTLTETTLKPLEPLPTLTDVLPIEVC